MMPHANLGIRWVRGRMFKNITKGYHRGGAKTLPAKRASYKCKVEGGEKE